VSKTKIAGVLNATAGAAGAAATGRWTNRFVIAQLALTPMLLCAAGLLMRSIVAQQDIDPGVPTSGIVRMRFELTGPRYEARDARAQFYERIQEELGRSGLQATLASQAPFEGGNQRRLVDGASQEPRQYPVVRTVTVGARYFEALRTRVVRGRPFTPSEAVVGRTPAIVNERFVELHAGGADPIGRSVTVTVGDPANRVTETFTVVGVAPNIRQRSTEAGGSFEPTIYTPYQSNPARRANIFVKSDAPPADVALAVGEQLRRIDPDIALYDVMTLDDSLARSDERLGLRVFATLISGVAAVGLFLATIGVYAVTAYAAAQRTREIGLRMALGAMSAQVWWLVTRRAARQLLVGLSIGMLGALAVGQVLRGVLIGTSAADPLTLAVVVLVLAAATLFASMIPSRRAMRLDPVAALRSE
jgi:predicted permease